MSASPSQLTQSSKRPLEEPSSPSRQGDQPEAKRPALDKADKAVKGGTTTTAAGQAAKEIELAHMPEKGITKDDPDTPDDPDKSNGAKDEPAEAGAGTGAGAAPTAAAGPTEPADFKQHPSALVGAADGAAAAAAAAAGSHDEATWIHIRAVISSPEAATVIGKAGENVSNIRKMSGAKCTVSDYRKGAIERILTVSGIVDAVAKAFGLIIRTLNNEPLGEPSTAQSKTYPLRLLVPHILIGSIIGKGGARIREIQEASGARLNASDTCLPLSSERSLVVMGVADAVHIATYYVGSTLLEQLNDRFGGPAASAYATRSGGPAGYAPGGMQVVPYCPQPAGGGFGNRESYGRNQERWSQQDRPSGHYPGGGGPGPGAADSYPPHHQAAAPSHSSVGGGPYGGGGGGAQPGPYGPSSHAQPHGGPAYGGPQGPGGPGPMPGGGGGPAGAAVTQQIFIPNDMVGAIIGKGGQKINEIRQTSGSVIKINEPQDSSNERLVTISGTAESNRIALYMLYTRLEQEKHRV